MGKLLLMRFMPTLTGLLFFSSRKVRPAYVEIGTNLSIDNGVLNASMLAGPQGPQGETGPEGPSRRIETYSGSTNGSGDYAVSYSPAYADVPCVSPTIITSSSGQTWRISASTVNGFTVRVEERNTVTILGIGAAGATISPVSGASLNVLVVASD